MIYTYTCANCGTSHTENRRVEDRDRLAPCNDCDGTLERNFAADIRSSRIITWKNWCACTAYDLLPTKEEAAARDKRMEQFVKPEPKPDPFQQARETSRAGLVT